jgi:hypothetical protein
MNLTHPDSLIEWSSWEPTIKPALEKFLKNYLLQIFIDFESRDCCGHKLSVYLSDENLCKEAKDVYIYSWVGNRESAEGSLKFMANHGIDIDQAILETKTAFSQIDFGNLENLLKYHSRFLNINKNVYERSLTFGDDQKDDGGEIRGLFNNKTLSDTVVEMLNLAQENLGLVSNLFSYLGVYQYNGKAIPDLNIKLSLQDIVDYLGGIGSLSEAFKEVLISEKFLTLDITLKRNLVIL